jgi:hypothetical protein
VRSSPLRPFNPSHPLSLYSLPATSSPRPTPSPSFKPSAKPRAATHNIYTALRTSSLRTSKRKTLLFPSTPPRPPLKPDPPLPLPLARLLHLLPVATRQERQRQSQSKQNRRRKRSLRRKERRRKELVLLTPSWVRPRLFLLGRRRR